MEFDSCMVDIETGDVDPIRGLVIQIAAIKFNSKTLEVSPETFDYSLLPSTQPNRRWSDSTREFWGKHMDIYASLRERMQPTEPVLKALQKWAGYSGMTFYSKPTHFDFTFLQSLFADHQVGFPFHFRTATDLNSFARGVYWPEVPPKWEKIIPFEGQAHNALDDCWHQLKVLYALFEKRPAPVEPEV